MEEHQVKNVIEAALLAADCPLGLDQLQAIFGDEQPPKALLRAALGTLDAEFAERGIELREVASGFRIQVRSEFGEFVSRLWQERPTRYSRALLETLALIAYRQPVTRGEIEEVRGVSVSTNIMRTLEERNWVRIVGHRDVPGKPALYATTHHFLDYFGLRRLEDLPPLAEIRDLDDPNVELELEAPRLYVVPDVREADSWPMEPEEAWAEEPDSLRE
ncbi:MAG: SMC-Scp complex subunit ScpB [Gammaproteobacteria bacterium]|nr:SMC-Scp complex subunit ScpB [Gammaproteobacteria bacterium]